MKRYAERWVYDPYFQYFTGEEFFQQPKAITFPTDAKRPHPRRRH